MGDSGFHGLDLAAAHANKAIPPLRQSDLHSAYYSNGTVPTRYEINLAAPPDAELVSYWVVDATLSLTAGAFVLVIFAGICSSRKARQQSFNLYLLYLMIPDFTFSILCGTSCLLNAIQGSYWSHWMCQFQQWYCVWGIGANCWLNATITYQLHGLLKSSRNGRRYILPSPRVVTYQAVAIYLYCALLGTWGLIDYNTHKYFPFHSLQISGMACVPVEVDVASSLFYWLFFMPIFSVIPIIYVVYVTVDIWRRKLLPPSGKRRMLAIYFGRIVMVFLILWGPYFLLVYVFVTWIPTSAMFAGGTLSHFQGPISAGISLLKPDIYCAVKRFLTCRCWDGTEGDSSNTRYLVYGSDGVERSGSYRLSAAFRQSWLFGGSNGAFGAHGSAQATSSDSGPMLGSPTASPHLSVISYASVWPNEDGEYTSGDEEEDDDGHKDNEMITADGDVEQSKNQQALDDSVVARQGASTEETAEEMCLERPME